MSLGEGTGLYHQYKSPSVALVCTGLGRVFRGYEASVHQLYRNIRGHLDISLYGGGNAFDHEGEVLWNLPRDHWVYRGAPSLIATFYRRYAVECATAAYSLRRALRHRPVDIIFTPDHLLAERISTVRFLDGRSPRIIFSNGAPFPWRYCRRYAFVHQKSLSDYQESVSDPATHGRVFLIANGFDAEALAAGRKLDRVLLRQRRNLPTDKAVVLSLAALQSTHKRCDWMVNEFALLDPQKHHLLLAGARGVETEALEGLCRRRLAPNSWTIISEPPENIPEILALSDVAALCSLTEGFPRALAEAAGAGLPILAHDYVNARWILAHAASFVNMTREGALAARIGQILGEPDLAASIAEVNRDWFHTHFSWSVVANQYVEMFEAVAGSDAHFRYRIGVGT